MLKTCSILSKPVVFLTKIHLMAVEDHKLLHTDSAY
jgi:hypothetical protein